MMNGREGSESTERNFEEQEEKRKSDLAARWQKSVEVHELIMASLAADAESLRAMLRISEDRLRGRNDLA